MIAGHPHIVRSSSVPLYMQGFPRLGDLGQDDVAEPSTYDPSSELIAPVDTGITTPAFLPQPSDFNFEPTTFDPSGNLIAPPNISSSTESLANMYAGAVASGAITPATAAQQASQAAANLAKAAQPFVFSPAPKVATRAPGTPAPASSIFTQQSIAGVPNWALLALAGGAALLAMGRR